MVDDEKPQETKIDADKTANERSLSEIVIMEEGIPKNPAPKDVRDYVLKTFYCMRPGNFEHAVEDITKYIDPIVDGEVLSTWLLAEIDHWDHEKERICFITQKQLLIIKYNFVSLRIEDCRKINLAKIEKIQGGKFIYPKHNMILNRDFQTGIRIHINKDFHLTLMENWNPLFNNLPCITFTQHKAVPLLDDIPHYMRYQEFKQALVSAMEGTGATFEASCEDIPLEIYVGLMSVVYNSNDFGYSKDRGIVSF